MDMRLFAFALALPACAQAQEVVIRSTTSEVLLDLVVRDKHERVVRDLKPDEIEVYEDGVRQNVKTFSFVDGREVVRIEGGRPVAAASGQPSALSQLNPLREINLVSIIFHGLGGAETRRFAQLAANEFLDARFGNGSGGSHGAHRSGRETGTGRLRGPFDGAAGGPCRKRVDDGHAGECTSALLGGFALIYTSNSNAAVGVIFVRRAVCARELS